MSEAEDKAALEHSTARLYAHVVQKGFQAGGVIGLGMVVPIMAYRRRTRRSCVPTALRTVGRSAAYGAIGTGVLTAAMIALKPLDEEGIQDRAYRIYWNEGQNRTDRFAQVGAGLGAAAAAASAGTSPGILLGGAAVGGALGVLAHVATAQPEVLTANNVPSEITTKDVSQKPR